MNLGIKIGNKRDPIFDENSFWVDTVPLVVTDFAGQDQRILKYKNMLLIDENKRKDRDIADLKSKIAKLDSLNKYNQMVHVQSDSVINELPTLYNQPPKNKNKKNIFRSQKKKKPG